MSRGRPLRVRGYPLPHVLVRKSSFLRHGEEGQALVEYALILVLVSIAAITLLSAIGQFPSSVFERVNGDF